MSPKGARLLSEGATGDLLQSLLDLLLWILGPTLDVLEKGRVVREPENGVDSLDRTEALGDLEIPEVLLSFPPIQETIELVLGDWISANAEMFRRLHRDRGALAVLRSCPDDASWTVANVVANLSDRHEGGRSVCSLTFTDGDRLIYKPRKCSGEQLWSCILDWLHKEGFPELKTARMVHRPSAGYSWVEFLPGSPCSNESAVERFYFRWGAQAALATIFGFADLHHSNWIAMHEHPILVDAEMFGPDASRLERIGPSVTRLEPLFATGLVPFRSQSGLAYRGLAPFDDPSSFEQPPDCWPRLNDVPRPPQDFAGDIRRGFDDAVEFIWAKPSRMSRINAILSRAARYESRALVRSTGEYEQLLRQSLHPRHMLTTQSRSEGLRAACYPAAPGSRIADAEADCLLRCCVPRFTTGMLRRDCRRVPIPTREAMAESSAHLSCHLGFFPWSPGAVGAGVE
ncbi:MAG TPA: type 2 lanthipeptide synthetase LanM [Chthoniobacterales bacterium]|nr:type 2 lanthipeptide synthetase LanM [Chthoniobacterales bacterium]